jgi:GTPase SAR1 family protein
LLKILKLSSGDIPQIYTRTEDKARYLQDLLEGKSMNKRMRIMLVGKAGVGKTTLVKNLIGTQQWQGSSRSAVERDEEV